MENELPQQWPTEPERGVLRSTFIRLIPASEMVSEGLYRRLFEVAPSLRPLFPADMSDQQDKLVQMLAVSIDMLNAPEAFHQSCEDLGARHVGYGAVPDHYPLVGQILVEELGAAINPPLTPDEVAVWARFYDLIARHMLSAEAK